MDTFGRSYGVDGSAPMSVSRPAYPSRRSRSAAADPAAPAPTMTMDSGSSDAAPRGAGPGSGARRRATNTRPSRVSTSQQGRGRRAGARTACPVRGSNAAWCAGQRTVPSASSPPASETP